MTSRLGILFLLIALLSFGHLKAQDERKDLDISAQCNVFYHHLLIPQELVRCGAGLPPVEIDVRDVKMITFEHTTGTVNFCPWNDSCKDGGADGSKGFTLIVNQKGMAGIADFKRKAFLTGVFVNDSYIAEELNWIDFTDHENYLQWGPDLQYPFYIGDGLTNKGVTQQILVPKDAEKLYLGFADCVGSPENYSDDKGNIHTTIVLHKSLSKRPPVGAIKN
jgi:hypothetical protein